MANTLVFRQAVVRSWGAAARGSGANVQATRRKIAAASDDAATARMAGLASDHASDLYLSRIGHGVEQVAHSVTSTGDRLVDTVEVVRSTDDASADLFRHWGGPRP